MIYDTTWNINLDVPLAACLPVFYGTWNSQIEALADKLPAAQRMHKYSFLVLNLLWSPYLRCGGRRSARSQVQG